MTLRSFQMLAIESGKRTLYSAVGRSPDSPRAKSRGGDHPPPRLLHMQP